MHSTNTVVRKISRYKIWALHCPRSIISENYKYLSTKYGISTSDWFMDLKGILRKITRHYSEDEILICNTIKQLCELRDGVIQCDVINNATDINLLRSIINDLCIE